MDTLKINGYINLAKSDLSDDPHFKRSHDQLDEERQKLSDLGYDSEKIVNILYDIWRQRIEYILENRDLLDMRLLSEEIENFALDDIPCQSPDNDPGATS